MHARTKAINQLKALLVTVPAALREQLQNLRNKELLQRCAQLRPGAITTPLAAARLALRSLARRIQQLSAEIEALVLQLDAITNELARRQLGRRAAIAAFSALILVLSFFRPVPEKRADWAAGVLQLVLGGAVGFAL